MAVLGYLPILKRVQGLVFGVHFWHDFPIILCNIVSTSKVLIL